MSVILEKRTLSSRVLEALDRAGEQGLTDFDLAHQLGAYLSSVNATRNSLVKRGLVKPAGRLRPSGRGGEAQVWVLTR